MKRLFILIFSFLSLQMQGQDLHFSQFMQTPLLINPANTGFIPDGDYRLGVNYRNQWASLSAFPYKTISAYGDWQLLQNREETGWLGAGGLILRDVAGTSVLTSTKVYGSLAYHHFPSQWNGQFFDVHQSAQAPLLTANQTNYLDLQVGMNYAYFPSSSVYINAGFSAMHLNRPTESFWANATGIDNRVAVRYNGFLNASIKLNDQVIIQPNVYYSRQAGSWEAVGGVAALYNVSGDGEYTLSAGAYYRLSESMIPQVGLGLRQLQFTFSYDVTASTLKNFTNRRGLCPTFR